MMNQEEKLCRRYQAEVRCFQEIPHRFEFDEGFDIKSCSVIFPPGYSIYVEEFILDDPGPDNFVLLDERSLEFSPKLNWLDREQTMWSTLDKKNPLHMKSSRRKNNSCVKSLKVGKY